VVHISDYHKKKSINEIQSLRLNCYIIWCSSPVKWISIKLRTRPNNLMSQAEDSLSSLSRLGLGFSLALGCHGLLKVEPCIGPGEDLLKSLLLETFYAETNLI